MHLVAHMISYGKLSHYPYLHSAEVALLFHNNISASECTGTCVRQLHILVARKTAFCVWRSHHASHHCQAQCVSMLALLGCCMIILGSWLG